MGEPELPARSALATLGAAVLEADWLQRLAASIALVACIWCVPYLPTNDGPQVALASHIQNHYADPDSVFRRQLLPNFPLSHVGFSLVFTPLEAVLPWRDALRIALSATALGGAWAFAWLVSTIEPRRAPLGLLGFVFAMPWSFYMGFFSYAIATALGLGLLAWVVRTRDARPGWARELRVAAVLFAVAVAHVFAAVWTGLALACVLGAAAPRGKRARALVRAGLVGLPSLGLFVAAWAQHRDLAHVPLTAAFAWVAPAEQARRLPGLFLPGPRVRSAFALLLATGALVAALAPRRRAMPTERALAGFALAMLAGAAAAPLHVPGWQFFSPRLLAPVAAIAVALVPFERLAAPRRRQAAIGVTLAACAASLAASGALNRRLGRGCADDLSGLRDPVRRSSYVLPVVLDPYCGVDRSPDRSEVPYLAPALHLGALYALAQGGTIPYLFAGSSAAYAFRLRDEPDPSGPPSIPDVERYWSAVESTAFRDEAAYRRRIVAELAVHGTGYEAILVFGAQARDVAVFDELGYVAEHAQGSLFVAAFRGCQASLRLPAAAAREPLRLAWGSSDVAAPLVDRVLAPAPPGATGTLVLPLGRTVCGGLWLRLSPTAGPGTPSLPCETADPSGRLRAIATATEPALFDCAPRPR